ncbi:MAG: hypothetical protein WKF84_20975 [Pyrinomonadaceae bacterium]
MVLATKEKTTISRKLIIFLDRLWIVLALWCPFVLFVAGEPSAMSRIPEPLRSSVSALSSVLLFTTTAVTAVWLLRQLYRWLITRQPLNVPKYLLLAAAVPMHWVELLTPMPSKAIAIVAILTIYHNLQYHRLIWFHNRKYVGHADDAERYGAAALISRRVVYYLWLSAFSSDFGINCRVSIWDLSSAFGDQLTQGVSAFFWGYAFIHYFLDSKIWRVRRDPAVSRALQM